MCAYHVPRRREPSDESLAGRGEATDACVSFSRVSMVWDVARGTASTFGRASGVGNCCVGRHGGPRLGCQWSCGQLCGHLTLSASGNNSLSCIYFQSACIRKTGNYLIVLFCLF